MSAETAPPTAVPTLLGRWSAARNHLVHRRRAHKLASDDRAGSFSRNKARRAWSTYVRREWRFLATIFATALPVLGLATGLMPDTFMRGVVVGGGLVAVVGAVGLLVVQVTGTAFLTAGTYGEVSTSSELRRLRKSGWLLINNVEFDGWNVDHILVGPGGLVVVETKWSQHDWRSRKQLPYVNAGAEQARSGARTLRLWLKLDESAVQPVVFCWSASTPERAELPVEPCQLGGTQIVYGRAASRAWQRQLIARAVSERVFDDTEVLRLWRIIEQYAGRHDQWQDARSSG